MHKIENSLDSMSNMSYDRSLMAADIHITINSNFFRQIDFIWLFTNDINFKQIKGISDNLDENSITYEFI